MVVFIILALLGFFFLVISLVFGGLFEHIGDFAHDVVVEHEVSLDHDAEAGGPSPFSIRVIMAFITGFGASGAIASYYHADWMISSVVGIVFGLLAGGIVFALVSAMYKQQASSGVAMADMLGLAGNVSVTIPKDGMGQVTLVVKESQGEYFARSENGEEIKNGVGVKVVKVIGDKLVVSPLA